MDRHKHHYSSLHGRHQQEPPPPPFHSLSSQSINPNFSIQNPTKFYPQKSSSAPKNFLHHENPKFRPNFQFQNHNLNRENPSFHGQQFPGSGFRPQAPSHNRDNLINKVDFAVKKAHGDLLKTGENISAWTVAQSALVMLQLDYWSSLGFQMQQVPSLKSLLIIEGKINAFIHCFVGARSITSLYDLEVEICKNEGIEQFEDLGLGPLLRHPLVQHYFTVNSEMTEVFKITTEEIIILLAEFTHFCNEIEIEQFMDFVAEKRSVASKEKLGIRIQSLGCHFTFIWKARNLENGMLFAHRKAEKLGDAEPEKQQEPSKPSRDKKHKKKLGDAEPEEQQEHCDKKQKKSRKAKKLGDAKPEKQQEQAKPNRDKKHKKRPLFTSPKKELDERFGSISERVEASSEDDSHKAHDDFSSQCVKSSDQVSSFPYPSATEEMAWLWMKGEQKAQFSPTSGSQKHIKSSGAAKRKRKYEDHKIVK